MMKKHVEDIVWTGLAALNIGWAVSALIYGVWLAAYICGVVGVMFAIHELRRLLGHRSGMSDDERLQYRRMAPAERIRYQLETPSPATNLGGFMFITGAILVFALDEGYYPVVWLCAALVVGEGVMLGLSILGKKDRAAQ